MNKTRKILLLEDEYEVISLFVNIIKENNSKFFLENWIVKPISLLLDNGSIWRYNLDDFDAIFIDRDNFLDESNNNYHDPFLKNFETNYWYIWDLGAIAKKIFPMSWSQKNNDYLKDKIIRILENTKINSFYKSYYPDNKIYYIESREEREYYEEIINNHILTKSYPWYKNNIYDILTKI